MFSIDSQEPIGSLRETRLIGTLSALKLMDKTINNGSVLGDVPDNDVIFMVASQDGLSNDLNLNVDTMLEFEKGVFDVLTDLKYHKALGIEEHNLGLIAKQIIENYWMMDYRSKIWEVKRSNAVEWRSMIEGFMYNMKLKYMKYFVKGYEENVISILRVIFRMLTDLGYDQLSAVNMWFVCGTGIRPDRNYVYLRIMGWIWILPILNEKINIINMYATSTSIVQINIRDLQSNCQVLK